MTFFDALGASIAGVDEQWFAKLEYINELIEDLQSRGMDIKYTYTSNMDLIIACYQDKYFYFKDMQIDDAIGFVSDLYSGKGFSYSYKKYISFVRIVLDKE